MGDRVQVSVGGVLGVLKLTPEGTAEDETLLKRLVREARKRAAVHDAAAAEARAQIGPSRCEKAWSGALYDPSRVLRVYR